MMKKKRWVKPKVKEIKVRGQLELVLAGCAKEAIGTCGYSLDQDNPESCSPVCSNTT